MQSFAAPSVHLHFTLAALLQGELFDSMGLGRLLVGAWLLERAPDLLEAMMI